MRAAADGRIRVGVDIVGVARVSRLLEENGALMDALFTAREQSYCSGHSRKRLEHLAARFAAKEAVLKAFGTGLGQRMRWTDVEIVNEMGGRPTVRLHGEVARFAQQRRLADVDVSLAHSEGVAIAHAVAVWGQ